MYEGLIFAGFGGQGVILSGKLLCIAAMNEGKHVSHIPSYGAEMRGGTANCSVIVSDDEIGSPLVPHPTAAVVLNNPSLIKFEPRLQPGGLLVYNTSLIDVKPQRTDITIVGIDANDLAQAEGSSRAANMIALGLLVKKKPDLCSLDALIKALDKAVSARNKELNDINIACLKKGYQAG
ncbi:MAG: 2-oxoacid:acceptor oxidoreductase family protein [Spirochaetales bacterium]|nr:2-oxoacid:acceptor oxidoreductase family protein [Spirochaetales bacterium]